MPGPLRRSATSPAPKKRAIRSVKGLAYLRAHNYWRTAEFLLEPDDRRRPSAWTSQVDAFDRGLQALSIAHERANVAYEKGRAAHGFLPGTGRLGDQTAHRVRRRPRFDPRRALLRDSFRRRIGVATECLRMRVPARVRPCASMDSFLRRNGRSRMRWCSTPYLGAHAKPPSIVLVGMSMGGYFAAARGCVRAAD